MLITAQQFNFIRMTNNKGIGVADNKTQTVIFFCLGKYSCFSESDMPKPYLRTIALPSIYLQNAQGTMEAACESVERTAKLIYNSL